MKLNRTVTGPQSGLPVILVHGLFGQGRNLGAIARRLADGRQVVVDAKVPFTGYIEAVQAGALLALATGQDPESDLIRLGTFSIAGQVVYFRIGHAIVARRMEWKAVGPDEVGTIKAVILANIRAFIATNRKQQS